MSLTAESPRSVTRQQFDSARGLINSHFTYRGEPEVHAFLDAHPFLAPLILEACDQIRAVFGDQIRLDLQIESEPDGSTDSDELFLLIVTPGEFGKARRKLRELDERWWRQASDRTCCKLNIDVEPA